MARGSDLRLCVVHPFDLRLCRAWWQQPGVGLGCASCGVGLGLPAAGYPVTGGVLCPCVACAVVCVSQIPSVVRTDESSAAWASDGSCCDNGFEVAACLLVAFVVSAGRCAAVRWHQGASVVMSMCRTPLIMSARRP